MSLLVAILLLLTSSNAIALEPAFHKFQKDEYGLLTAEDQRTFDKEYSRAQSKGYIRVSFNVRHYGETRSNDQMERIEQGRRYAQRKRDILKDAEFKREIVSLSDDISPNLPDRFLRVTAVGLLIILNDDRISSFVVYRRPGIKVMGTQTTESIVEDLRGPVAN